LKVVLSVLLAVTLADALELDELAWAAFSGYMVMRSDVSESTRRGLMRILGTLSGAAFGVVLAPAIVDNPMLLVASLLVATWIGIFGSLASRFGYAWVFFGITAGLVMTEALAAPDNVLHFAATRLGEIAAGTASCVLVANLFSVTATGVQTDAQITSNAAPEPSPAPKVLSEPWFEDHWALRRHATRSAPAMALLPIIWRWLEITDFSQPAVT
jgi:uncharacterized membrane protein YccC